MNKKIANNIIFGILGQVITVLLGLLIPRLIIINYGSEMNGLLSSVIQIYACLALLEAGVGTATLQALYKPLASNDKKEINAILSATSNYYNKIGKLYLIIVVLFSIIYPILFAKNIDFIQAFLIILFTGLSSVINFFFHGKYVLLLRSDGKSYILSALNTTINILSSITKVILISNNYSVVEVQISFFIINLLQLIYITYIIKKDYSWIDLKEKPNYKAISQKNSVLVHEITAIIFNNTDMVLITVFLGLEAVSIYAVYNYFFRAVYQMIMVFSSSTDFALGRIFNIDKKKFIEFYEVVENYILMISFLAYTILFVFIMPLIKIYTKDFTDVNYINYNLPLYFITMELLTLIRKPPNTVISSAGHFKETRMKSVIESTINIVLSIILINVMGIEGVLVGTIVALFYRTNDIIIYANTKIMDRNPLKTYYRIFINITVMIVLSLIGFKYTASINNLETLIIKVFVYGIITSLIYLTVNTITNPNEFRYIKTIFSKFIKEKIIK
ncbi:MAG: sugar isomerase [Erysipelotrichaceae bacterium]|nr:sugar isomerase [Erysipelotrichaceae bacterium]